MRARAREREREGERSKIITESREREKSCTLAARACDQKIKDRDIAKESKM